MITVNPLGLLVDYDGGAVAGVTRPLPGTILSVAVPPPTELYSLNFAPIPAGYTGAVGTLEVTAQGIGLFNDGLHVAGLVSDDVDPRFDPTLMTVMTMQADYGITGYVSDEAGNAAAGSSVTEPLDPFLNYTFRLAWDAPRGLVSLTVNGRPPVPVFPPLFDGVIPWLPFQPRSILIGQPDLGLQTPGPPGKILRVSLSSLYLPLLTEMKVDVRDRVAHPLCPW